MSPKDPKVPKNLKFLMGGENTYTQELLKKPPKEVSYTHFTDALKGGEIKYSSWNFVLRLLMKLRILPPDAGVVAISLLADFDLIHCHAYNLKLDANVKVPVVLSDSSSNYLFLRDYLGWPELRIKAYYFVKRIISKALSVYDQNLNLLGARLIVWSKFAKKIHKELGCDPKQVFVIPPAVTTMPLERTKTEIFNILFVGTWFERKGGHTLLQAYKALKKKYPWIKLSLVGQVPKSVSLPLGVWHKEFIVHNQLIRKVFPKADVLVLVPPKAEGYGMVVLEAASLGIPSIVSSIYALPELVENAKTGFVIRPGSVTELVAALDKLIVNPNLRRELGLVAKKRFLDKFSIGVTNKKLSTFYERAIKSRQ